MKVDSNALLWICSLFALVGALDVGWSSQGGNLENTRHVSGTALDANFSFVSPTFVLRVNASISATPALIGGLVIFPTWDGNLWAYNEANGNLKWKKNIARDYYGVRSFSGNNASLKVYVSETTPAVVDDRYAAIGISGPADVLLFRYDTGFLFWKKTLDKDPSAVVVQSPQAYKGRMYVGTDESVVASSRKRQGPSGFVGSLYAVDVASKSIAWQWAVAPPGDGGIGGWTGGGLGRSSPILDISTGVIYFSTGPATGKPAAWSRCADAVDPSKVPLVCEELMYPEVYMNSIVGLNGTTGKLKVGRRFDAASSWEEASRGDASLNGGSNIPPVGRDGEFSHSPTLVHKVFCDCSTKRPSGSSGNDTDHWETGFCNSFKDPTAPYLEDVTGPYRVADCPLADSTWGLPVLYVAQRSGFVWALEGVALRTLWVAAPFPGSPSRGTGSTGIATDGNAVYLAHENFAQRRWFRSATAEGDDPDNAPRCGGWVALNALNGTELWSRVNPACFDPTGEPGDPLSNGRSTTARVTGAPSLADGLLFVGSTDVLRTPAMGTFLVDVYGDGEEVVNVGNGGFKPNAGGWVYALDASTGTISSSFETGAPVFEGFSLDKKCAWVGQGGEDAGDGSGAPRGSAVYGFCSSSQPSPVPLSSPRSPPAMPAASPSSSSPSPPAPSPAPSSSSSQSPSPKNSSSSRPPYFFDEK